MFRLLPVAVRRPLSIRGWFTVVAVTSVICALIVGALAGWYSWEQQKLRLGQALVATSRALIQSGERELEQATVVLRSVAGALNLHAGDLTAVKTQSADLLKVYGYILFITELAASPAPLGTDPVSASTAGLPSDWQWSEGKGRQFEVRPLTRLGDNQWAVGVQMVATSGQGAKYLLTLSVPASRFQRLIDNQRLPPAWSPVFLDHHWAIVARFPERFIGQRGANYHLKDTPPPDSVYEASVLEGHPTFHARSRSERFGWTVAIAVPKSQLATAFMGPAAIAGLSGFAISLFAACAIILFAAFLGRDVDALRKSAAALMENERSEVPEFRISELASVGEKMEIAAQRLAMEQRFRQRVVEELAHRLRNKVATVQAIVRHVLKGHSDLRTEILGRLESLSATDELMIATQGRGADLADIVDAELAPFRSSQVSVSGPQVSLDPKRALTMALLLHELATNASKYGAFSVAGGKVAIKWAIAEDRLEMEWRESDGPAVAEPSHHGFGSRLITEIVELLGGKIDARFDPEGLVCRAYIELADGVPSKSPAGRDAPDLSAAGRPSVPLLNQPPSTG